MEQDERYFWTNKGPARLNRRAIPDIAVIDHEGRSARFYTDLTRDRLVLIAFTSIAHDAHYPCTAKLSAVRAALDRGPAAMAEIYTLTLDPVRDTRSAWAAYGARAGAGRGWRFLHAAAEDVERLRGSLFVSRGGGPKDGARSLWRRADVLRLRPERAVMDCSLGMVRYGDEARDIWGGAPVRADAAAIAERLEWLTQSCAPRGARRRAGPFPAAPASV